MRLLINSLANGNQVENVPNLGFLKDGVPFYTQCLKDYIIYDDIMSWDLFGDNINIRQIPYIAYVFTSRGCPYSCRFCFIQMNAERNQRKCVFRSANTVLNELEYLNKQYGINVFTFADDNFFSNKKRAIEILVGMKQRGYYLEQAGGTFSGLSDEVISSLKGVCQTVMCSIETASERLIKIINKPICLETIPGIISKLNQAGINSAHNFMFGLPGEDDDDRKKAVDMMIELKKINPYIRGIAYFYTPLPGTPMFDDIERECGAFPRQLSFWRDCEIIGQENSYKYRPWLSKNEQMFITEFIDLFKDIFQSINQPLTKEQRGVINNSPRLRHIFSSANNILFPKDRRPKYLLDDVLRAKGVAI